MARTKKLAGAGNAALVVALTVAIAALVNILGGQLYGRLDLTEHQVNVLSDASKDAVRALDGLEVRVYISDPLPDEIPSPYPGRPPMRVRGLDRQLKDKLAEYQATAGSGMRITYVTERTTEEGKKAKLKVFRGKGGTLTERGLVQDEFVLGATFHYKNAMEVFDLALFPPVYEFEITKRLLRLKDKADNAITMKDVLRAGEAVADATRACVEALEAAAPPDEGDDSPLMMLTAEAGQAKVTAYRSARPTVDAACADLAPALAEANAEKGRHHQLDRVLLIGQAFSDHLAALWEQLEGGDEQAAMNAAVNGVNRVVAIGGAMEQEHADLTDSPGRRRIGFICAPVAFCPFPDGRPLVPKEIEGALVQKNPILGQMLPALSQIQQQINGLLAQVNQGLFRARGFDIVEIDLDEELPDDVQALVVFGPRGQFSDYHLYQLDQFVMRGGSLVVFVDAWDVTIQGYTNRLEPQLDPARWKLTRNTTNLDALLTGWGITPTGALVVEPERHGNIALMTYLQTNQGYVPFQTQEFPYPLIPTFDDLDDSDPLVRATSSVTMPFVSALKLEDKPGVELTALVRSSPRAATLDDPAFPLEPGKQAPRLGELPTGEAIPVIAVAKGELPSHFTGRDAPAKPVSPDAAPDADADEVEAALGERRPRLDKGDGRVLVIGSNLGLEPLSRDAIFPGFNVGMISGEGFDFIEKFREYQANFQNWSNQVQQVQHTLNDNLQFLSNALDWSIARDALVELRSKQITTRPLAPTEEGDRTALQAAAAVLAPGLFLLAGLFYLLWRRRRQRRLSL